MRVFKRKIYNKLKKWKSETEGTKALLIEGARRIGKSTIVEEFAKNEYRSYILIDFNLASDTVISAFNNYLNDLDTFSTCTVEPSLSARHPIAYFPLSNPSFHFSVDYCCSNNSKCSASLS